MKWRLSVLSKLLLIVLPIVLIAIFVIANTVIKKTEKTYYETEYEKYIAIADFIRSNLDVELIKEIDDLEDKDNGNVDLLEENLYDILSADSTGWSDSIEVTIYSYDKYGMNRSLVSSTGIYNFLDYNLMLTMNQLEGKRIKNTDIYVTDTNAYYNHYTDVFSLIRDDDGEILAIVSVSDDFAELARNLDEVKMNIIIQTFALMIVLVILMVILSLYINSNLRRTSAAIREIGEGNYDEKIENISNDELGDIAKSVNHMADSIRSSQQSIITGMSTMIESRDNSTGGHIRRTSLIINEFAQTLKEHEHSLGINDKFIQDLTKAAPMHDLGKIAVDDDVLRKPGKYTEEEYEKMKEHALEGARIIETLLKDSDDREFAKIAVNVAHYHHEKWNGTGYPEGLKGRDIPIEARIMALADVFDALVSKRCYKDAFDYETAYTIIRDNCGTHFDPELGELFLSCYEKFEKLWEKYGDKDRYVFCKTNEKVNYHHPCASLRDPSTTFISSYNQNLDICHGIAFELGPVDACPDSAVKRFFQLFYAFVFVLFNTQRLPNNKGKLFRGASYIMYKLVPSKKVRYKIWKFAERKISQYSWENATHVCELRGSIKFMFKKYPKEWFDSVVYFDFCGHKVPLMKGYDQYLSGIFGNYKKRPPKSAQIPKHDLAFSDMDRPYTYYKGIKYFPGTKDVGGAM